MIKDSNRIIITNDNYNQRIEELDKLRQDHYILEHEVKNVKMITDFIDSMDDNVQMSKSLTNSKKDEIDHLAIQIETYQKAFDEYINKIEADERNEQELLTEIQKEIDESLSKIEELKSKTDQLKTKRINAKRQIESYNIRKTFIKQFLSKDYSSSIKEAKVNADVGNIISFGAYQQDKTSKEKTPIEWIILDIQDGKALLVSLFALDCKRYNEEYTSVTWESCSLRKWLNETFVDNAFNTVEQKMIQSTNVTADRNPEYNTDPGNNTNDKVFLLSINEANKYFTSIEDKACEPTDYAVAQGAYKAISNGNCWWWLRSPGRNSYNTAYVYCDGDIYYRGSDVGDSDNAVRPALWIDLESII